jgi:acyl-CoA thioesterase
MSESPFSDAPILSGMAQMMGLVLDEWKPGQVVFSVEVTDIHLNNGGVAHGGLITTMLDSALGGALVSQLPKQEWCATTQLSTHFISPLNKGERATARGMVVKRGRNVAHLSGELHVGQRLIATATGTWVIWEHKPKSLPGR